MRNYQCKKCRTVFQKNTTPSTLNCPAGAYHSWKDLGEVGNTNYQCKKCGTVVRSKNTPSTLGCPSGVFHSWNKM